MKPTKKVINEAKTKKGKVKLIHNPYLLKYEVELETETIQVFNAFDNIQAAQAQFQDHYTNDL